MTVNNTISTNWNTPDFNAMSPDAQIIAAEWFALGRKYGFDEGYDHAQREFWNLPSYEAAVKSCIDLGSLGIDRREADRRKREVSL